jgi:transcriptional regulator with XRE-family HTH domain
MKFENLKTRTANGLGVLLRHWRDLRGKSQFDLSLDTGVSQKQISFVESGWGVPSRQTLVVIAQALDIPLRDRNTLLLAGSYAPIYSESDRDSMEMKSVIDALKRILRQQEPFPAMVMDRYWNVLMMNECAPRFFNCFIDMTARAGPQNKLHLLFDPKRNAPVGRQLGGRRQELVRAGSSGIRRARGRWKIQGTRSGVACLSRR